MKRVAILMCALLTIFAVACGRGNAPETTTPEVPPGVEVPSNNGAQTEQPVTDKEVTLPLKVYYADGDLTQLIEEQQEIVKPKKDEDKYAKAMELLEKPKKETNFPLWKNFQYHSITFNNGTLTIDCKSTNQYNLGSSGEAFAIDALKQTMFQFSEVKEINILVDGKPTESLMGHVSFTNPITRES
ncbi:GerMN domain-containing protein [Brevibacillus daliensis]|uniref:GerMN domain-containing protein n=1 Tax=Brevibacillus daliensis TaxID=2892995 RepID=UPI001E648B50|nr:GerMN domain-containing protein [Brevibacillus daliensis]